MLTCAIYADVIVFLRAMFGLLGAITIVLVVKYAQSAAAAAIDLGAGRAHGGSGDGGGKGHALIATFKQYKRELSTGGLSAYILMFVRECRNVAISLKGDDIGLSHVQIGTAFGIGYACDSMLFLPVGWAMDRYG